MQQFAGQTARIRQKLAIARQTDKSLKAFGASNHQYLLAPPATGQQLAAFEKRYNVRLPDDYKAFLLEVGLSGAGPFYGLYSPERSVYNSKSSEAGKNV